MPREADRSEDGGSSPARREAPEPAAWLPIPNVDTLEVPVVAGPLNGGGERAPGWSSAPRDVDTSGWESPARQAAPEPGVWFAIPNVDTLETPVVTPVVADRGTGESTGEFAGVTLVPHRPHHRPGNRPVTPSSPRRKPGREARRVTKPEPRPVVPAPAPVVEVAPVAPTDLVAPGIERPAEPAPTGDRVAVITARRVARLHKARRRRLATVASLASVAVVGMAMLAVGGGATRATQRVKVASPAPASTSAVRTATSAGSAATPLGLTVTADGRDVPVTLRPGGTVADALAAAGITLRAADEVSPGLTTAATAGVPITVTRVTHDSVQGKETVPFRVVTKNDASIPKGTTKIVTPGRNGVVGYTMARTLKNGVVAGQQRVGSWVITGTVDQVVAKGTGSAASRPTTPAPAAPAPAAGHVQTGSATHYGTNPYGAGYCASRTAPKGSRLTVTNVATGASTTCIVNDFGPEAWTGRILDLHPSNFAQIAPLGQGVVNVRVSW